MAAEWQTESMKHWNFRLPAKICKRSLASSAYIYLGGNRSQRIYFVGACSTIGLDNVMVR
ncbi:hypothetical protein [Paenibacillus sp. FSL H7-0714]|uniref:hypothetical protein n=1 Tax=Paenibacillus sp. FSL H7-0714 TaxID=2954735 RepID=UPI0030F8D67E